VPPPDLLFKLSTPSLGITSQNLSDGLDSLIGSVLSTPSLGITFRENELMIDDESDFQLPLSGSLAFAISLSCIIIKSAFNSLSRDHIGTKGVVDSAVDGFFQLPLSGSLGDQSKADSADPRGAGFQLPLSGSQQLNTLLNRVKRFKLTFNSLSRDHLQAKGWSNHHFQSDFQLPLSGSLSSVSSTAGACSAFNSLSRDHLVENIITARLRGLSTPSLGITSDLLKPILNAYGLDLSTPSLGITCRRHGAHDGAEH